MVQQIDGSQALEPRHARKRPSAKRHSLILTRREGERGRGGEGGRGRRERERERERKRKRGEGGTECGVMKRREWKGERKGE